MIYTLTANPSLDYVLNLSEMKVGEINRLDDASVIAGGKGINVSQILSSFGVENIALGFEGGESGKWLMKLLDEKELTHDFVTIENPTRINVKIYGQEETALNPNGPKIQPEELKTFMTRFEGLKPEDIVIMSGSLALGLPEDFYSQLAKLVTEKGASFVIDTTGQKFLETLKYHPLLVKPNDEELEEIFGEKLNSDADIVRVGRKLIDMGAQNALISLGSRGGILLTANHVYFAPAAKGELVNSVGAGDSSLGAFIAIYQLTKNKEQAFCYSMAAGGATAFHTDIATREQIEALVPQIQPNLL